jgi:diacylglycerol kinase (ATP)
MQNESPTAQKSRSGISRILHATRYSLAGLRAAWHEAAFRQEALLAAVMVPTAFWLGKNWLETAMLVATVMIVLITELLNTGIEKAIDRMGTEWHAMAKVAKDVGSAAVLLSLLLCAGVWLAAIYARYF